MARRSESSQQVGARIRRVRRTLVAVRDEPPSRAAPPGPAARNTNEGGLGFAEICRSTIFSAQAAYTRRSLWNSPGELRVARLVTSRLDARPPPGHERACAEFSLPERTRASDSPSRR